MTAPISSTAAGPARDREMFDAGLAAARIEGDCWVPVSLPWRHVHPGDIMLGPDGSPYLVRAVDLDPRGMLARVEVTADGYQIHTKGCDPDDLVPVLVPALERDALNLARDQLGAQLIARRTA